MAGKEAPDAADGIQPTLEDPERHSNGAKADELIVGSIKFNDGSIYKGTLKNGVPYGLGTCFWADGNNYDGEWRNGVMHGFGTYIWTSGQRYDGEWKDGRRHGVGVKVYTDGSIFDGFWHEGRKNGVGVFRPAAPQAEPRRFAVSQSKRAIGGHYDFGSPFVADRVQPSRNSKPDETSRQPGQDSHRHLMDLFSRHPALRSSGSQEASPDSLEPPHPTMAPGPSLSTQLTPDCSASRRDAAAQHPTLERDCDSVVADSMVDGPTLQLPEEKKIFIRKFEDGRLIREEKLTKEEIKMIFGELWQKKDNKIQRRMKKVLRIEKKLQQRQGQLVYKGMAGYDLMVRLQLGIRISIGRANQQQQVASKAVSTQAETARGLPQDHEVKLVPGDLTDKKKIFFPAAGSTSTPAHPSTDFKWKDYSPKVFHNLRCMWGCHGAEYMLSLGGSSALWQLNSPGKSGCLFFLSDDEKFLIKTMRKTEIKVLLEMLPEYYKHMTTNPQSLIPRYYGVHGVKQLHGRTVRFVVMSNIFCTDLQIHRKFDLKGSTQGRTSGHADPSDMKTVFKDLDLDVCIQLAAPTHHQLVAQMAADADFLRKIKVMDYSLLLGIHYVNRGGEARVADSFTGAANMGGPPPPQPVLPQPKKLVKMEIQGPPPAASLPSELQPGLGSSSLHGPPFSFVGPSTGSNPPFTHPASKNNFDVFSNRAEVTQMLAMAEQRMRKLGYEEQRMNDILGLAKLKILGDKLHKTASKSKSRSSTVLKAVQQFRKDLQLVEGDADVIDGASDDGGGDLAEHEEEPSTLGFNMSAMAVAAGKDGAQGAQGEEVVIFLGIIDILQDYNIRKLFERGFKSILNDSDAISVASPTFYSSRFLKCMEKVFAEDDTGRAKPQSFAHPWSYKSIPEEESQ